VASNTVQDCIVGSGPAAAVLALRLSEAGRSVVVLEEGLGQLPQGTDGSASSTQALLVRDSGLRATHDGGLTLYQGRCLGGSATLGQGICEPLSAERMGLWQQQHGWSTEGDPVEAGRRAMAHLAASPMPDEGHNRNNALLMEGALRLGLSLRSPALATGTGIGPTTSGLGGAMAGLLDAAGRAGADIRTSHRVARLGRDGDRLTEATGAGFGVAAERFFLCAGALQGADLLHASGITPSGLGRGASLIHRLLVLARFDEPVNCDLGGSTTVTAEHRAGGYSIEPTSVGPALAAAHTRAPLPELRRLLGSFDRLAAAWCVVPGGTGALTWGRRGRPRLSRSFGVEEFGRAREALVSAARLFLAAGAREVVLPVDGLPPIQRRSDLAALEERELGYGDLPALCLAPQGSCKMGSSGPVAPDFRLRGLDNLYVCDASLFPTSAGLRPMVPTMTMAELLASRLT
jgi:choline dehydrogenase-like flavoprotein